RIQLWVDRRFDRRTFDAVARVRVFTDRLGHDTLEPADVQTLLSEVLRDPALVLCFVTADGTYIDHFGNETSIPVDADDRAITVLGPAREPIGIIGHRRSLDAEGRLLADVLTAARPSVEYARLQAELRV